MNRARSRFTSLGYTLRKAYRRITTAKPSLFLVAIFITGLSIFFLGGGVYDLLEKPLVAIPLGSTIIFFYPAISEQTILDSFIAMLAYFFGVAGILFMYQSTRYAYRPRQAFIALLIGVAFILIAYVTLEDLILVKLTSNIGGG